VSENTYPEHEIFIKNERKFWKFIFSKSYLSGTSCVPPFVFKEKPNFGILTTGELLFFEFTLSENMLLIFEIKIKMSEKFGN
jgi:hypothetical protein